jgi:M6 family metalloprotease-like protein
MWGLFATSLQAQQITQCIAAPFPVTIAQPDGSELTIIGKGTPRLHYTESTDGYTLLPNKDGVYEYAVQTREGGLTLSGIKASEAQMRGVKEISYLKALPHELRETPEFLELNSGDKLFKQNQDNNGQTGSSEQPLAQSFPTMGKRKVLMLLIQYPDYKPKYTVQNFKDLMNKEGYGTAGSFHDFYMQNSFGKLDLNVDVFGWYTADSSYKFYGQNSGLQGTTPYLIAEAIDAAHDAGVDFSQYDNDGDGNVDGILVVHSGPGAEEGGQSQYIWSHRASLYGKSRYYDGVRINDYIVQPETRGGISARMVGVGVFCHEFGHLLGLPDLYDVNYKSEGLGDWSLMAGGVWNDNEHTPACFDAWCKVYNGWINPVVIDSNGVYTMSPGALDSQIYKINTPVEHEYFLLENRQFKGFDSKLPSHGLAIWRVNDSILSRTLPWNIVNTNTSNYGVALMQADGRRNLELNQNRGDNGDLYPGFSKNTTFDDAAKPSSRINSGNSGISIYGIEELSDSNVQFNFGSMPLARFNMPKTVCENALVKIENNSKFATSYEWNFGDGAFDTAFSPYYKFSKPGTYYVKLTIKSNNNILSDSASITVLPSAKAAFTVSVDKMNVNIINNTEDASTQMWYWGDNKVGYSSDKTFTRTYKDTGVYVIKMVALGQSGCNDTMTATVHIDGVTGIEMPEPIVNKMTLYPNPAQGFVNLYMQVSRSSFAKVYMYDMTGRKIGLLADGALNPGDNTISIKLPQIRSGIYMVEAEVEGHLYHFRLNER